MTCDDSNDDDNDNDGNEIMATRNIQCCMFEPSFGWYIYSEIHLNSHSYLIWIKSIPNHKTWFCFNQKPMNYILILRSGVEFSWTVVYGYEVAIRQCCQISWTMDDSEIVAVVVFVVVVIVFTMKAITINTTPSSHESVLVWMT